MTTQDQRPPTILCFATQGVDHGEERRIRTLLEPLDPVVWPFDRAAKARSGWKLFRELVGRRPDLAVMEGTGIAGGLALIAARLLAGVPYVVSSGDAVGPYLRLTHPRVAPIAAIYERILCRLSAGFIGWSPYLAGRALTFGAPRAMTAASWSGPARGRGPGSAARRTRDTHRGDRVRPDRVFGVDSDRRLLLRARARPRHPRRQQSGRACGCDRGRLGPRTPRGSRRRGSRSACDLAWPRRGRTRSRAICPPSTSQACRRASTASGRSATRPRSASTWPRACRSSPARSRSPTTSTTAGSGAYRARRPGIGATSRRSPR